MKVIKYKIAAPTILDFLKHYLRSIFGVENIALLKESTKSDQDEIKLLVYKMSIYLAKMSAHDYELSG